MDDLDDGRCGGQDMAEPQDARSGPSGPASPPISSLSLSSCSSSSSSSSDSDMSDGEQAQARVRAAALPKKRSRRDSEVAQPEPPGPPHTRYRRDETFTWRGFRFTFCPGSETKKASYMVLCRYHSRAYAETKCTRSATFANADDREVVVRRLKTWCVHAPDFDFGGSPPDRAPHQQHDRQGLEVLSDEALEAAVLPDLPDPNS